jgi:hypothetical protein
VETQGDTTSPVGLNAWKHALISYWRCRIRTRLCFVDVDKRVVSTFGMAAGRWTHLDPPRERAGFEARPGSANYSFNAVFGGGDATR